jgi:hypothetical protein
MEPLPLAQKIKIIRKAQLKIPVYRAPTENYDHKRPSKFDSHIEYEAIMVSGVIAALLGIISYLSKELLMSGKPMPKDVWTKLSDIKSLLRDQQSSIRR